MGSLAHDPICADPIAHSRITGEQRLDALVRAIDNVRQTYGLRGPIDLIGYDDGGYLALLIAQKRGDIRSVRTVASAIKAPLDSTKLRTVMQVHYQGAMDPAANLAPFERYTKSLGPSACFENVMVPGVTHEEGWVNRWPELLAKTPECRNTPLSTDHYVPAYGQAGFDEPYLRMPPRYHGDRGIEKN